MCLIAMYYSVFCEKNIIFVSITMHRLLMKPEQYKHLHIIYLKALLHETMTHIYLIYKCT